MGTPFHRSQSFQTGVLHSYLIQVEQHSTDLPTYNVGSDKLIRGGASVYPTPPAHALNSLTPMVAYMRPLFWGVS